MAYTTEKSKELFQKAQRCLVGGLSSSFHKAPWNDYPMLYGSWSRFESIRCRREFVYRLSECIRT